MTAGSSALVLGAIEGGGTKFVCEVGTGPDEVHESIRVETTTPDETLGRCIALLAKHRVRAVGVGMFGPLDLARGATLRTPKPGWDGVDVRGRLVEALGVPVAVDTDVNAAAVAEARHGAGRGKDPVVYVTVGTGVGGGVVVRGRPLHGLMHPELGHLAVPRLTGLDGAPDTFDGVCPFHGRCLEGLVAGPALTKRLGHPIETLPDTAPLFALAGRYLGHALASVVLVLSPERIIVGGGVGARPSLLSAARASLSEALGGYLPWDGLGTSLDALLVPPGLGARAGICGAFALAMDACAGV